MAGIRIIKVGRVEASTSSYIDKSTMDIDNNVDTTVLGSNFLPGHCFDISVEVSGWDVSAGSVECPTISRSISYDHLISGKVYMLASGHPFYKTCQSLNVSKADSYGRIKYK